MKKLIIKMLLWPSWYSGIFIDWATRKLDADFAANYSADLYNKYADKIYDRESEKDK